MLFRFNLIQTYIQIETFIGIANYQLVILELHSSMMYNSKEKFIGHFSREYNIYICLSSNSKSLVIDRPKYIKQYMKI